MDFVNQLKYQIQFNLPGERSHLTMAPVNRPISSFARKETMIYRESAVSILLIEEDKTRKIILIQRPPYEGTHGGQISFPGGKMDPEDHSDFHTALRECQEEIGVNLQQATYLGELTPVFIPVSKFNVHAHVFYLTNTPSMTADPREVESIFHITCDELLDENRVQTMEIDLPDNQKLNGIPCFDIQSKQIWGATALMLNELKMILKEIESN